MGKNAAFMIQPDRVIAIVPSNLNPAQPEGDRTPNTSTNLFDLPGDLPAQELFETLVKGNRLQIERIISTGQTTPTDQWYDQDQDEWVVLLQGEAELTYGDGSSQRLQAGDYVLGVAE